MEPDSIPRDEGVEIFLRIQTGLGVHSASYKMNTGAISVGKSAELGLALPPLHLLVPWRVFADN